MKNQLIALSILLSSTFLYSQTEESPWIFGIGINSINPENLDNSGYNLPSLSLSRYIFNNFSVGINYSENELKASNEELYYYSVDGIIKYTFQSESKVLGVNAEPYLFAGYGLSNFGEGNTSLGSLNTAFGASFGAGVNFQLTKNIALNTGISYKSIDEKNAYSNLQHVVGIKFNFEKGDSDGDGVPDKKDHCPDHPGIVELNGCPDSDGDGIKDDDDKCPNLTGLSSMDGCPDSDGDGFSDLIDPCPNKAGVNGQSCPDSDGDGILDNLDNCPNEAGLESNGGCKLPDLDNDGVPNINDNCPNEAGSKDLNGCPNLPKSLESYLNNFNEIFFDFDSHIVRQEYIENLTLLSSLLSKYQYINLNIDGHTSNEGETDYNMSLSERRSSSVKNTIMSNGINSSRLFLRNFGEENPIYPNIPLSEKKKNRRVLISVRD